MKYDAVFKKIDRYLKKDNMGPLLVDVQNKSDLDTIMMHYHLATNKFIALSDPEFCKEDEFPSISSLENYLVKEQQTVFVREFSSFYRLKGEKALEQALYELLSLNIIGHVIILTYQCDNYLAKLIKNDVRLEGRICLVEGEKVELPQFVFLRKVMNVGNSETLVKGLHRLAATVEAGITGSIQLETAKSKESYPQALYVISELNNPYEILCTLDNMTTKLYQEIGTDEDWLNVLVEFQKYPTWEQLISTKIGPVNNLHSSIIDYQRNKNDKRWLWLYLISLQLFGAKESWYLQEAALKANSCMGFIKNIYRLILEVDVSNPNFELIYTQRKSFLDALGNPVEAVVDFCKIVLSKEQDAIYYLTDNTIQEKKLLFKLLNKYGMNYSHKQLLAVLSVVYPDLYEYLQPYYFKNKLLDDYFQDYKYQKVINKIFPEFLEVVEKQAVTREYNSILPSRSSVVEAIDTTKAQTYFTDAMGVEYLSFIMAKCREYGLMAKVTVCRSELPTITSRNKDFWDVLSTPKYPIENLKRLDDIKHHGAEGYDYTNESKKLPSYLLYELDFLAGLLEQIKVKLLDGSYNKAILISDHGASRLAVIHETENLVEMAENGKHSGRCCPKSDVDVKPENVTDADDFWALANYDRFKGGRKANVEVHGGATLEEVAVPIIEITYLRKDVEVKIMPLDAAATFSGIPQITVSYRKKAALKIFATQPLVDVSIEIDGHRYDAKELDDNFYIVEAMPEVRRAKLYKVDVYSCGNLIASELSLQVKKESVSENSIL